MKKSIIPAVFFLSALLFAFSCSDRDEAAIALVNGVAILEPDLDARVISALLAQVPGRDLSGIPSDVRKKVRQAVFNRIVSKELLFQAAEESKLLAFDDEVTLEVSIKRSQHGSEKEFQDQLKLRGLTEEKFRLQILKEISIEKYMDWVVGNLPSEKIGDPAEYYEQNRNLFIEPESSHILHIFLPDDQKNDPGSDSRENGKIDVINKELETGTDFKDLARKYSKSEDAKNGGELDGVVRGILLEPVEEAAFTVEPGSDPVVVTSRFGLHLIKVLDRKDERLIPFTEVEGKILQYLRGEAKKEEEKRIVEDLLQRSTIDTLDSSLKEL